MSLDAADCLENALHEEIFSLLEAPEVTWFEVWQEWRICGEEFFSPL
jgi:hypothetical protein